MGAESYREPNPYFERKPEVHVERAGELIPDLDRIAFSEFVTGLQTMSVDFDTVVANFAWCAGQIAGDPDANARLRGMMDFALALHRFGLETATQAVDTNSGIKIQIVIPETEQTSDDREMLRTTLKLRRRPGIIVGLTGARRIEEEPIFDGVAVVENSRGQEAFVAVRIKPNGETILNPKPLQEKDPHATRLMRDLYPKA